jgi:hypothetical protein
MVRPNTCGDRKLELLGLCEAFGGKVTWVEPV